MGIGFAFEIACAFLIPGGTRTDAATGFIYIAPWVLLLTPVVMLVAYGFLAPREYEAYLYSQSDRKLKSIWKTRGPLSDAVVIKIPASALESGKAYSCYIRNTSFLTFDKDWKKNTKVRVIGDIPGGGAREVYASDAFSEIEAHFSCPGNMAAAR